jgi:DNA-binding response OmpR family regulator
VILLKGDVELYYDRREILLPEVGLIHLSPHELIAARTLLEASPRLVTFMMIAHEFWGTKNDFKKTRQLNDCVSIKVWSLRKKMCPEDTNRYIRAIKTYGYVWETNR